MDMELTLYTVIPRSPIRGIGYSLTPITEETEIELNELQALKILLAGNQLLKDGQPVTIADFVPDVDPQAIRVDSLVDDVTAKNSKFVASSECKVFGNPRDYKVPIVDATESEDEEATEETDNSASETQTTTEPTSTPASDNTYGEDLDVD